MKFNPKDYILVVLAMLVLFILATKPCSAVEDRGDLISNESDCGADEQNRATRNLFVILSSECDKNNPPSKLSRGSGVIIAYEEFTIVAGGILSISYPIWIRDLYSSYVIQFFGIRIWIDLFDLFEFFERFIGIL